MKSVEIVLGGGERREMMEGINLRSIVSAYINITMYPPVQLLYASNKKKKKFLVGRYFERRAPCFISITLS
jgi:hypothetical protein